MKGNILDYLVEKNEFPIIFIGSGISKRYLDNYPSWLELLEYLWVESKNEGNFYGYLTKVRNEILEGQDLPDYVLDYEVNIRVATELEKAINDSFADGELAIDGIGHKQVYEKKISPFKSLICNKFSKYSLKNGVEEEFEAFKEMLGKSQIILTTNYDLIIEDAYNTISDVPIKTYVGQRGFFEQTTGFSELYKIHGCASESNSIIITEKDYDKFDKDSVLISAKIISMLLNSPIIFIGYSLKDRNIRNIIKDLTRSLTDEELLRLEKKLIVVEWEEGQDGIIEGVENDSELGCRLTTIKTNNYKAIYDTIKKINQGVSPAEIRKYQHVIKKLIVQRGKEGTLDTVLLSPSELHDFDDILKKKLVVAIGDSTLIFVMPTEVTYMYDYVAEKAQHDLDTILRFIASKQGRLPIFKYVTKENIEKSNLTEKEKKNLTNKLEKYSDVQKERNSLKGYKRGYKSIEEILNQKMKAYREYFTIASEIDNLEVEEVKKYILGKLDNIKKNNTDIKSEFRKLVLMYDIKKNLKK